MGLGESPQGPCKTGETILCVCELTVNDNKTAAWAWSFLHRENKREKEFIHCETSIQHLERVVVVYFISLLLLS